MNPAIVTTKLSPASPTPAQRSPRAAAGAGNHRPRLVTATMRVDSSS
jgi:hypothetical protein